MIQQMTPRQSRMVDKLRNILEVLETSAVSSEILLHKMENQIDKMMDNLKYIPNTDFEILPKEMQSQIFSYLPDEYVLVAASVCQDWTKIAMDRINKIKTLYLNHEDNFKNTPILVCESMLKSITILDLNLPFIIMNPVQDLRQTNEHGELDEMCVNIDSKLLSFTINNLTEVIIGNEDSFYTNYFSRQQTDELFRTMSSQTNLKKLILEESIDLFNVDQRMLAQGLANVEEVILRSTIDFQMFFKELSEMSHVLSELSLNHVNLEQYLLLPYKAWLETVLSFVKVLGSLRKVEWIEYEQNTISIIILRNVILQISRPNNKSKIQHLKLEGDAWDWTKIPTDMFATVVQKLETFSTENITQAQAEAVEGFPGVDITYDFEISIKKYLTE